MDAEKFLLQYQQATIAIKTIEAEIENIINDEVPVKSTTDYDGMPHGTKTGDPTANTAIMLSDKIQRYQMKLADMRLARVDTRGRVFNAIMQVNGVEQEALYARYILLKDEEGIKDCIGYERSMMYEYLRRGIDEVQRLINIGHIRTD